MRSNQPHIKTIEGLFDWFVNGGNIYWKLWYGTGANNRNAIAQNIEDISSDASWQKLEESIQAQSANGAVSFKILTSTKPSGNYGLTTYYMDESIAPAQARSIAGPGQPFNPMSSINGLLPGGIPGYLQNSISGAEERITLRMQLERALEDNEKLQEQLDAKEYSNWTDEIKGAISSDPQGIIGQLITLAGMFKTGQVASVAGGPPIPPSANEAPEYKSTETGEMSPEEFERRFQIVAEKISKHINLLELLENIDLVITENAQVVDLLRDTETLNKIAKMDIGKLKQFASLL